MSTKAAINEATPAEISERLLHLKKVHELLAEKLINSNEESSLQKLVMYSNHRFREFSPKDSMKLVRNGSNLGKCVKCHSEELTSLKITKIKKNKKRKQRVEMRRKCSFCGQLTLAIVLNKPKTTSISEGKCEDLNINSSKKIADTKRVESKNTPKQVTRNTFSPGAQNLKKLMSAKKKLNRDTGLLDFLTKSNSKIN